MKKNKDNQNNVGEKHRVLLNSEKMKIRDRRIRILKLSLLIISLILMILYFLLRIIYEAGNFTISLDNAFAKKYGIVMYENQNEKVEKKILEADKLEFIDNISIKWLPDNLDSMGDGNHNGDNYIAYTFYIENKGSQTINYWYTLNNDYVIKNVDNAIRIMVYLNGEKTVYAKAATNGNPEPGTVPFADNINLITQKRAAFNSGDIDRFTVVVWIEGDDPQCLDDLIGGEMKMHMEITEEHLAPGEKQP